MRNKADFKWVFIVTILAFIISIVMTLFSTLILESVGLFIAILITLLFILLGIVFDIVGVAVNSADEKVFLDSIDDKYPNLEIIKYEVWYNDENSKLLGKVQEKLHIARNGVPTTVIGEEVMVGFNYANGAKIERAINYYLENEYIDVVEQIRNDTYVEKVEEEKEEEKTEFEKQEEESDLESTIDVPVVGKVNLKNVSLMTSAVIIGLIDGFNPCAMWVLLFLISVLIGMKDKKRMWALGVTFLVVSAFIYMLIMLSWISIAVKMTTVIWVRNLIALLALIGAFVNIRNYFKSHDGCNVVDAKKRKKIFSKIRKFTSEKSFILAILGVVGLAVSVNLVELACSAGLPLVFTELLALNNVSNFMKIMYTLLYVLFFLLDDLVIFIIAMVTMEVTGISTKYNKYSHLLGGIIMLVMGLLLIFKPEWLMFQFK